MAFGFDKVAFIVKRKMLENIKNVIQFQYTTVLASAIESSRVHIQARASRESRRDRYRIVEQFIQCALTNRAYCAYRTINFGLHFLLTYKL